MKNVERTGSHQIAINLESLKPLAEKRISSLIKHLKKTLFLTV